MSAARPHRVRVTVNGHAYVVEVGDLNVSPLMVSVNGQPYLVNFETLAAEPAEAAAKAPAGLSPAVAAAAAAGGAAEIRAPLPGVIGDITVEPGAAVTFGQTLCTLEAMKMKSAIRAPRAGVIARVAVAAGQSVNHGQVLFAFQEG